MAAEVSPKKMSREEAFLELAELAKTAARANLAYYNDDDPVISDATYDHMKRRILALELQFPNLKSEDSPTDQIGAPVNSGFGKI